ncbi:MAG: hypothetical protein WHS45_06390 [Anaerolinea sp.]
MKKATARFLISVVFLWNVQAAVLFLIFPQDYLSSFMLTGEVGEKVIQSLGILFIMWNVPYFLAMLKPEKERMLLFACVLMQAIGVIGETTLFLDLSPQMQAVKQTVLRFILFDSAGLLLLMIAWWLSRRQSPETT